ncbi:MAG: tetratricopeptide repeat protein, partial [Geminicoccaceae bacterium]
MSQPELRSLDLREAELFRGRSRELNIFNDMFDPPPAMDERRVLLFTGVGGLGKSALARRIVRKLKADARQRPAAWALIDFADEGATDRATALLQLRLQLGTTGRQLTFPIFDVAFARYHGQRFPGSDVLRQYNLTNPDGAIARRLADLFGSPTTDCEHLQNLADGLNELIANVPLIGTAYKYVNRSVDWWSKRALPLIQGIDGLGHDKIAGLLPRCLGADLQDAIAAMSHRVPVTVIGDTLEQFHRDKPHRRGRDAFHNDAWLRELIRHSPGVLFTLLSRDPLEWADYDVARRRREWQMIVRTEPLDRLDAPEAERVLESYPVAEPEIRRRLIDASDGLPFNLAIQLDIYDEIKADGDQPAIEDFADQPDEVVTRFLNHMGERSRGNLETLALARHFDQDLYEHLFTHHRNLIADVPFGAITRYSVVESETDGRFRLHQLMRDIVGRDLAERHRIKWNAVHEALFEYWDARCQPEDVRSVTLDHETALTEAAHHLGMADQSDRFLTWTYERWRVFYDAARYGLCLNLWQSAYEAAETVHGRDHPEVARTLGNLGVVLEALGDYQAARDAQKRALKIFEKAYGPDHPEVAITLGSLGIVLQQLGDYQAARDAQKRALKINEKAYGPEHPEVAR